MRQRGIVQGGGKLISNTEHHDIVTALASRNGDEAAAIMGAHGAAGYRRLLLTMEEYAEPAATLVAG
ncbi:MAG: hypothetical protein AB7E55_17345, partial [Pigmentiphaga sp.]